jgi:ferredoxin-like protein FixX
MINQNDKITLVKIMLFYALLSFVACPIIGYELLKKKKVGITYGIIVGCGLSIILWYKMGQNKLELN